MTVEYWRMGAAPVPGTETDRFAREFEADGWDGFTVGEALGLKPDPYVVLGTAAKATTRLKVGTAVSVPVRSSLYAAGAMATVHALSGGRSRFCIGRGDGGVKVLRRGPMKLAEFEAYVAQVQAYLRGQPVDIEGVVSSMARLPEIDPSMAGSKPPVDVAATGPKMIALAARHADGVNFSVGADLERIRNSISVAHDACRESGRAIDTLDIGCFVQLAVTDGGDDDAREAIRGLVITHARFSGFEPKPIAGVGADDHGKYRTAVEVMEKVYHAERGGVARKADGAPGEIDFYPREAGGADLVDEFAITGTAEECADRLRAIAGLGVQRIYIGTRSTGTDLAERNASRCAREVLSLVRQE